MAASGERKVWKVGGEGFSRKDKGGASVRLKVGNRKMLEDKTELGV